jgi:hypothetical protein
MNILDLGYGKDLRIYFENIKFNDVDMNNMHTGSFIFL